MSQRHPEKGLRISEYKLLEKLGQGGFGEVWKAEHAQIPGKFVAIKIPTKPESVDLIRREAVFQHQMEHPNIVRTIGLDVQGDPPYFVMEYVDGKNLRQFMADEGILPPPYAIDVAVQVLEALAYAHSRGIVHKDIKPENILVERRRVSVAEKGKAFLHYVKITDLGLGNGPDTKPEDMVLSEQGSRTSGARMMSGTLFYMAPEQMSPGRNWDARADLYSMGVVLYEMLTGELPLGMDLPSELNPVVTPELDAICKRALSLDRDTRYSNARDMIADLQRAKESFLLRLVQQGAPAAKLTPGGELKPVSVATPPPSPAPARRSLLHSTTTIPMGRRIFEWAIFGFMAALAALSGWAYLNSRGKDNRSGVKPAPVADSATILVDTLPPGAEIFVDDARVGTTPGEIKVAFARHTIRLVKEFHDERVMELLPRTAGERRLLALVDARTLEELDLRDLAATGPLAPVPLVRQKGTLRIETPGLEQVLVQLDGREVGVTPLELRDILAGGYSVKLTKEGYRSLEFDVTVRAGGPVVREIALLPEGETEKPKPATVYHKVSVNSTPPGALVYLNEAEKGRTPCEIDLSDGVYRLRLELRYHDAWEEPVKVEGGRQAFLVPLVRIRGRVSFESDPPGAIVIVDGQERGTAPLTDSFDGGPHSAEFVLDGHFRKATNFEVADRNQLVPVRMAMQKIPPGLLSIDCEIAGADIYVDDKPAGKAPLLQHRVATGKHRVRILGTEREVEVEAGIERKLSLKAVELGLVAVKAGEFEYGSPEPFVKEHRLRKEFLPDYHIDATEVTNAAYGLFLDWMQRTGDHSKCDPAEGKNKNHKPRTWDDPNYESYRKPTMPVVGVDWYDAVAFAAWAGKRLPTEFEWEKAARGSDGRTYPWGSEWDPLKLNWGDTKGDKDGFDGPAPVGTYPKGASPWGALDMAGNVWEWCADYYDATGTTRVLRGGSFREKEWVKTWSREFEVPSKHTHRYGFRCVVDAK